MICKLTAVDEAWYDSYKTGFAPRGSISAMARTSVMVGGGNSERSVSWTSRLPIDARRRRTDALYCTDSQN